MVILPKGGGVAVCIPALSKLPWGWSSNYRSLYYVHGVGIGDAHVGPKPAVSQTGLAPGLYWAPQVMKPQFPSL